MVWVGEEETMYGYSEPNKLHTPTRQDTAVRAVHCPLLLMDISMMIKTNYSLDIMNCGGEGPANTAVRRHPYRK
jgi:hypothetical protein